MRVVTGREMQAIDRAAIEKHRIPSLNLMQQAGTKVALRIERLLGTGQARKIAVVCGSGNNGGDGFVAARLLYEVGFTVKVFVLGRPDKLTPDARVNFEKIRELVKPVFVSRTALSALRKAVGEADLIVDALFGTGFSGRPDALAAQVIKVVNESDAEIFAVDVPSGVEADTGRVAGEAVKAERTITFGLPKLGCLIVPGAAYCGDVEVVDIGFPAELIRAPGTLSLATPDELSQMLPKRKPDTHKKECGRVFVVAGSVGMTGAAAMTAEAALRAGAGIVTLGVAESLNDIMEVKLTEVMTAPLPETPARSLDAGAYHTVVDKLKEFDVAAIGPGLSQHESTVKLVRDLLENVKAPIVLDADGLNALAGQGNLLKKRPGPTVITPHPGELARLSGQTVTAVQRDRVAAARRAARTWKVVCVLKGTRSVIADPSGQAYINPTGNSGLASAGTGDVLTGVIASLWAQGTKPLEAAVLGCYLHGLAGDMVMKEKTIYGLIATDLIESLPKAVATLAREKGGAR